MPFNYSSSNWAVSFDLTEGFLWLKRVCRRDIYLFFTHLWTFGGIGQLSFCVIWALEAFSHWTTRPRTHPQPRVSLSAFCVCVCVCGCLCLCVCVLEVMGDTSERSKPPTLPPRCPCGFWGSSKTMNLCSKCFADVQKKQPVEDCTPKPIQSTGSSQSPVFSSEMSSSSSQSLSLLPPSSSEQLSAEEPLPAFSSMREGKPGQPGQPMISHSPCSVFKNWLSGEQTFLKMWKQKVNGHSRPKLLLNLTV